MKRNATLVICEHLNRPEPQVRKNALTALAAIGDEESLERLIASALGDSAPEVRAHASREIAQLEGQAAEGARERLHRLLEDDDPQRRAAAYALLGRLRLLDFPYVRPRLSWPRRWRLASSLRSNPEGPRRRFFHGPTFRTGLQAGGVGVILLTAYLVGVLDIPLFTGNVLTPMIVSAPVLSALLCLFLAKRSLPAGLHYDRRAAILDELCSLALASFLPILVGVLLTGFAMLNEDDPEWFLVALGALLCLLPALMAVRWGTLMALGVAKHPSLQRLLPMTAGAASGALLLTLPLALIQKWPLTTPKAAEFAESLWIFLLPSLLGLAAVLMQIDREPSVSGPIAGRLARPMTVLLSGLLITVPLAVFLRVEWGKASERATTQKESLFQPAKKPETKKVPLGSLPARQSFQIDERLRFVAEIKGGALTPLPAEALRAGSELSVHLYKYEKPIEKPTGKPTTVPAGLAGSPQRCTGKREPIGTKAHGATKMEHFVEPGCYEVEIKPLDSPVTLGNIFSTLWHGVSATRQMPNLHLELLFDHDLRNACQHAKNGVCNEPKDCRSGTDTDDCAASNTCRWANDGVCDEPRVCDPGTDLNDCQAQAQAEPMDSCQYANDGVCDEPLVCSAGTDQTDCRADSCRYAKDGECDDPGLCEKGTDATDCRATAR